MVSATLCVSLRQIRLAQLKEAAKRPQFGTLGVIQRDDFVQEVTEASRECWVVVLLNQEKCARLGRRSTHTIHSRMQVV